MKTRQSIIAPTISQDEITRFRHIIRKATHDEASHLWKLLRSTFLLQEYVAFEELQILLISARAPHEVINGSRSVAKAHLREMAPSHADAEILHRCLTLSQGIWSGEFWAIVLKTIDKRPSR